MALPEGGKFAGMRTTVVSIPRFSSTSQKGCPWRSSSTLSDPSGIWYLPSFSFLSEGSARLVDRYGIIVFGSRWTKSKMPWPPASMPVMKFDHATGLWGGIDVPSGWNAARAASRDRFGRRPSAIICFVSS